MSFRRIAICLVTLAALAAASPALAGYGSARELLDAMLAKEQQRADGISNYAMDLVVMNHLTTHYFERARHGDGADGGVMTFRLVPPDELRQRAQGEPGIEASDLEALVGAAASQGGAMLGGGRSAGLGRSFGGAAAGGSSDAGPWDVRDVEQMQRFMSQARIVGREQTDGRDAHHVRAENLDYRQVSDGQVFEIRAISMWVDARDLVMLKMHMEGQIEQDGQAREMTLEKIDSDFRTVPGSRLILPYRSVMRMSGLLGPEEQREMENARAQLAQLDQQMASMPADQKRMMESMMGGQIESLRKMIDGGAFEIETAVREVRVNVGIAGAVAGASGRLASLQQVARQGAAPGRAPRASNVNPNETEYSPVDPRVQPDAAAIKSAREACLREKSEKARAAAQKQEKKRRFRKLAGALGRIVGRHGGSELVRDVSEVTRDVYDANATASDLQAAADALGISVEDIKDCESAGSGS